MNRRRRIAKSFAVLAGVAFALLLPFAAAAQGEDKGDDADVGADTTLVPVPAKPAPRASSALMLDLARAGSTWVAVGQRGNVLLSADGSKWQQVPVPVDTTLTRVRFVDATRGWAVGYDGTMIGSTDGGKSWKLLQFDAAWGKPYYDVLFFDADNGLLAGANGTLKKTTDAGKSWESVSSDALQDSPNIYNLVKLGDGNLLMTGERGFMARSADQGKTWVQLKSPYTGSFFGTLANGASGALIFGLRGNAFYAVNIAKATVMTAKDIEQLRTEAANPENAHGGKDPISAVAGWVHLKSDDTEALFGGAPAADGSMILVGQNGRVMRADIASGALERLSISTDINMNAAQVDGSALIVVGTSGITRLPLH
jgi:photosystem II stability/assembly factor-like uncharacterized protein